MHKTLSSVLIALAVGSAAAKDVALAPNVNEAATARHFASLIAGPQPKLAELTMFMTQMPKGGDLHHHYSGAIYAEQYLDWVDTQGYCVDKTTYRIETRKDVVAAQRALPPAARVCLSAPEMQADDASYREMLQRWSSKDFYNHGALQSPPDAQFFQTFGYFGPVSGSNLNQGLLELKQRAIAENVGYIETMFKLAPSVPNAEFDNRVLQAGISDLELTAAMGGFLGALWQDEAYKKRMDDYVANIIASSANVDDDNFTMRYQAYVFRLLPPSQVFSAMAAAFESATRSRLIVGVNIVGAENGAVAMRDYTLHMKMLAYLRTRYPSVRLSLHAGELALGMVPPEGLTFHIDQAIALGGARRIGHGIDIAHERNAPAILKSMRDRNIPVEINLTSNEFILGIKDQAHPVTLYRQYGVPFVISTDDAGVSRNNLSNEYVLFASRYHPDYTEIKKLSYDSLRYGFMSPKDKERLTTQLDARFARFEADIAAMKTGAAVH
jgi:adenosine deaminase